MIKTEIKRMDSTRTYQFRAEGHADYAEAGKDIVCAAVSALTQAAAVTLLTYAEAGHCTLAGPVQMDNGAIEMSVVVDKPASDACIMTIFSVLAHGLEAIAKQYPDNVGFKLNMTD